MDAQLETAVASRNGVRSLINPIPIAQSVTASMGPTRMCIADGSMLRTCWYEKNSKMRTEANNADLRLWRVMIKKTAQHTSAAKTDPSRGIASSRTGISFRFSAYSEIIGKQANRNGWTGNTRRLEPGFSALARGLPFTVPIVLLGSSAFLVRSLSTGRGDRGMGDASGQAFRSLIRSTDSRGPLFA